MGLSWGFSALLIGSGGLPGLPRELLVGRYPRFGPSTIE